MFNRWNSWKNRAKRAEVTVEHFNKLINHHTKQRDFWKLKYMEIHKEIIHMNKALRNKNKQIARLKERETNAK